MKVKELLKECQRLLKNGLGDKDIYISKDDEGNGYHFLYYGFTTDQANVDDCLSYDNAVGDTSNIVILG